MPSFSTDEKWLLLPNPNYNESDFTDERRSQAVNEAAGIDGVWSPLKANGNWKLRQFAFDKAKWSTTAAAEQWVRENRTAFKAFGPMPRHVECFEVGFSERSTGSTPTEAELEQINRFALEPLTAEDLYVRTMRLTNDRWGKHFVRLSRGFQKAVISTMPGKSLLLGHPEVKQLAAEPIGRFFDAWVERDQSTGAEWGYAKFYLVKTAQNEHARAQIDGGVWQYTSIGMELDQMQCSVCGKDIMSADCRHIPGNVYPREQVKDLELDPQVSEADPNSVYCGVIYRGQGTAIEGSIVYLPELNGTEIVAEAQLRQSYLNGDFGQAKATLLSQAGNDDTGAAQLGDGQPGDAEPTNVPTKEREGDNPMSDEMKGLEAKLELATTEKTTLEAKLTKATDDLATLQSQLDEAKATIATHERAAAEEKAFRGAAVAELTRIAGLTSHDADLAAYQDVAGEDLVGLSAEKLLGLSAAWQKQFDTAHPTTGSRQSTQSAEDKPENDADTVTVAAMAFIS